MSDAAARFWDWAVRVYADPAVSGACLELQDTHGQCVPLLLWAAWLGGEGVTLDAQRAARAVAVARAWHDEVLVPIRAVRRRMKSPIADMADAARLQVRERVKALELDGERALMSALAALAAMESADARAPGRRCATDNLTTAARGWNDIVPHPALLRLVEAVNGG